MEDHIRTTELGFDAYHGRIDKIRAAIVQGIDWNQQEIYPLHGSLYGGREECVELLLNAGSPVVSNTHYLMNHISTKLYEKFLMNSKYESSLDATTATNCLSDASQRGSLIICEYFLKHGANPNDTSYGLLPLYNAARNFRKDLIEVLINHGADVNIKNGRFSILRLMAASGNKPLEQKLRKEVYELLVSHGALAQPPFSEKELELVKNGEIVLC